MEFVPSDAYIIMGHGKEPKVTLEDERTFTPCACKIKAKEPTIGTRSNNGYMDLDSFFIVPDNCIIVVRAKPGEVSHSSVINSLLTTIGDPEQQDLFKNPLSNTRELLTQLGPVSIYKPGDLCPNFEYIFFFNKSTLQSHRVPSHIGLLKTPLVAPITLKEYDKSNAIIPTINEIYAESVFPKKETVKKLILGNILQREPTNTETTTFKDLLKADNLIEYCKNFFSVTQKQLLKIGDDGIAKRPGVYYNFVCRNVDSNYYRRLEYDFKNKVNPNIVSIREQPSQTQDLFKRVLNETLRKRKPYIRNLYTGGKRKRTRKLK